MRHLALRDSISEHPEAVSEVRTIALMTQRYTHLSMKMRQSAIGILPPIEWRKKGTKRAQKKSGDAEANF